MLIIVTSNKSKHFLVETELKKLEKFDATYFRGKNYFDAKKYFKPINISMNDMYKFEKNN